MCSEHTRDLFALEEGDEATLVLDDGSELEATVVGKHRIHSDDDSPTIWEQRSINVKADGFEELTAIVVDGLGSEHFPSHSQLLEVPDDPAMEPEHDDLHGYVTEVRD